MAEVCIDKKLELTSFKSPSISRSRATSEPRRITDTLVPVSVEETSLNPDSVKLLLAFVAESWKAILDTTKELTLTAFEKVMVSVTE